MHAFDLPGYKLEKRIPKGGMTDLYIAFDPNGQKVVVRFIREKALKDKRLKKSFIHGIDILEKLDHPNIVKCLARGTRKGMPYAVIEYHESHNLRECIAHRESCLDVHQLTLARQLARALNYVHNKGFLHMDVKPENILVRPDTKLILVDFDLAVAFKNKPIKVKKVPGTPGYLAPETLRDGIVTESSEVYSFGVVVYEMLTLHKPFESDSMAEYHEAVLNPAKKPFPVRHYREDIAIGLEAAILKCLEKQEGRRYPSISLVLRDLEKLL